MHELSQLLPVTKSKAVNISKSSKYFSLTDDAPIIEMLPPICSKCKFFENNLLNEHLGCFNYLTIMIKAAITILAWTCVFISFVYIFGVKLIGHLVILQLTF